jgi:hypothetical protein
MAQVELKFLHACAVAAACEARVEIAPLASRLGLGDPIRTLELFEQEYLLRRTEDGCHAEALHPIRSDILAAELSDPALAPWQEAAREAFPHIPEADLETFLLHAFVRKTAEADALIDVIGQHLPHTWTGIAGICRALLWLGIREYVAANHELISDAQGRFGEAWRLMVRYDIAGIQPGGDEQLLDTFDSIVPAMATAARELRIRQTTPADAFRRLTLWLGSYPSMPTTPGTASDWAGFAEVNFWIAHLKIETPVRDAARTLNLAWAFSHLSLTALGEVVFSLACGAKGVFQVVVEPYKERIVGRFREETKTVYLEESQEVSRAHFIVGLGLLGDDQAKERIADESKDKLHNETMRRIELLRLIMPDRKAYGAQGYGHRLRVVPWPYDPTTKEAIAAHLLPPRWAVSVNAIFHNLGDWVHRPPTWRAYAEAIVEIREQAIAALVTLRKALTIYFVKNKPGGILGQRLPTDMWDRTIEVTRHLPKLPQAAVDEWGFAGEGMEKQLDKFGPEAVKRPTTVAIATIISEYQIYLKATNNYLGPLGNFFNQSVHALVINSYTGRLNSKQEQAEAIARFKSTGLNPEFGRLSLCNFADAWKALPEFQRAFRDRLAVFVDPDRLDRLERKEKELVRVTWALWYQFTNHPELRWDSADLRSTSVLERVSNEMRGRVHAHLNAFSSQGRRSAILSETVCWDDRPALWLSLDVDEPNEVFDAFEELVHRLEEAFESVDIGTLEQHILDQRWTSIFIIPFHAGYCVGGGVWRLPTFLFYGKAKVLTPERTWALVQVEPDATVWQQLGIDVVSLPEVDKVRSLQKSTAELLLLVDHITDFRNLPEDLDEKGSELLNVYVQEMAGRIGDTLNRALSQWSSLAEVLPAGEELERRPFLQAAGALLLQFHEAVLPMSETETSGQYCLNLETLDQWAERLKEALGWVEGIRLLYVADAVNGT